MAHHVSGMTQLIELTLSDDNPYGMPLDFRCLAALTRLRVLRLLRGGVSSEALATLAVSLPSSLEELRLGGRLLPNAPRGEDTFNTEDGLHSHEEYLLLLNPPTATYNAGEEKALLAAVGKLPRLTLLVLPARWRSAIAAFKRPPRLCVQFQEPFLRPLGWFAYNAD